MWQNRILSRPKHVTDLAAIELSADLLRCVVCRRYWAKTYGILPVLRDPGNTVRYHEDCAEELELLGTRLRD